MRNNVPLNQLYQYASPLVFPRGTGLIWGGGLFMEAHHA